MSAATLMTSTKRTSLIVYEADIFNCSRHPLVDILDNSPGGVGWHRKVDLDPVDASLQEAADFLGDRIDRWYTVEHSGERTAKALVGSVEQRTKHKEPRAELRAAV